MVKMKIENDELWDKVKDQETIKGLSVLKATLLLKFQAMQNQEPTNEEILKALNEIITKSNK